MVVINGLDIVAQLKGIGITIVLAAGSGLLAGKVISLFGKTSEIYNDAAEFADAE
jgi:hypothetical protein